MHSNRELRKVIAAAFIGTVIEWYDFFLYGTAAALVFGRLFFPNIDPVAGTMAALGTYTVGFLARPLGGVLFGYVGDRFGRKIALVWTLLLMGLSTFLVGCLPTYDHVGVLAPLLLVLLCFVQGVAVGGEWGGAVLLSVESGYRGHRGFLGSWTQAGVPMGLLVSTGAFSLVSLLAPAPFMSWGWRAPFWFGIVLTVVGFAIRRHIQESPLFLAASAQPRARENPLVAVLRSDWRSVLIIIGARLGENACFYVFTVFVLSYATEQLHLLRSTVLNGVLLAAAAEFITIPLLGALSDRIGRRSVCASGALALMAFAYPFFWMIQTGDTATICTALVLALALAHAAMYAPQAAFFAELFGTRVRFSGVSLGYQLSTILAGGLAPIICVFLLNWAGGSPWAVAAYLMAIGAVSAVSVLLSRETNKTDISGLGM